MVHDQHAHYIWHVCHFVFFMSSPEPPMFISGVVSLPVQFGGSLIILLQYLQVQEVSFTFHLGIEYRHVCPFSILGRYMKGCMSVSMLIPLYACLYINMLVCLYVFNVLCHTSIRSSYLRHVWTNQVLYEIVILWANPAYLLFLARSCVGGYLSSWASSHWMYIQTCQMTHYQVKLQGRHLQLTSTQGVLSVTRQP